MSRILPVAVVLLILLFGAYYFDKTYNDDIKSHPQLCCYDSLRDSIIINALNITDLDYANEYIRYYKKIESCEDKVAFNFPLQSVTYASRIYVLDTLKEYPELVKIHDYSTMGRWGRRNYSSYVFIKHLHEQLPDESLIGLKKYSSPPTHFRKNTSQNAKQFIPLHVLFQEG